MTLDPNALVLATGGNFSSSINGRPFQQETLITHEGYQYATWYHNGGDQDIYIARRRLTGSLWETVDTGYDMENGNQNWDSHNAISMGISGDGRIHMAYDHHVDGLRYLTTDTGVATSTGGAWNSSMFGAERDSLNPLDPAIPRVTYPRFTNIGDDLVFTYRDYGSGNGDQRIANYYAQSGLWSTTRTVTQGRSTGETYDDINNNPSNARNSYHNGFHTDPTGRLHTTWTWRETTQDGNHDILYAYSDDNGFTWRNNDGALVGTNSSPITLNSPGIEVVDLDRRQALLNQQGQVVDADGGVHVLMFHRKPGPTYTNSPFSDSTNSEYYHYYRDPQTGSWDVHPFPAGTAVGDRPRIGVDGRGNLFGLYTQGDDLVIAGAEKQTDGGYADWKILYRDQSRDYEGTPLIDNRRLFDDGVLSVLIQEKSANPSPTQPTGSPLRVLEFLSGPALASGQVDGSLRFRKNTGMVDGEGLGFVTGSSELYVGQSGTSADPYDRAAVMVFQLPDLGSIESPFRTAMFQGFLSQTVTASGVDGDLYGIARRDTPEILNSDYYGQTDVADPNATLLQDDLLVEDMFVNTTVRTSEVGNANLVDFLNEQYDGGAGIGDYVFLRLNADANTTQRWSLYSADAANPDLRPQLLYYANTGDFLDGDYNLDGVVDAADYSVWRDNLGKPEGSLANDPNSGSIGIDQYNTWRQNYGKTLPAAAASAATPEPGSRLLLAVGSLLLVAPRARWSYGAL